MKEEPQNIQNSFELKRSELEPGDRVHLTVCGPGQTTDDAIYLGEYVGTDYRALCGGTTGTVELGVKVKIKDEILDLPWTEIAEFWPIRNKKQNTG